MKKNISPLLSFAILAAMPLAAAADVPTEHALIASSDDVKWGPAPPALPSGAQVAVLAGDPAKQGLVTLRLKVPAGFTVAPHWHPSDEHVTVISGSLSLGMGDKVDTAAAKTLEPGGYVVAPANMHHFATSRNGAVIQISLMGPFEITYVNAADDPRNKSAPAQ